MATPPDIHKALNPKTEISSIVTALTIVGTAIVASPYRGYSSVETGSDLSDPGL
ncbi:hypothetical protein [Pontibacter pudoricolor]|uniref:hypothetical protein n=1 Tax=Pontibacter pudoricolor TaxID=2694930 RepID=UPI001390AF79|nr:hypothetical protein [Pontibacter pudoricolor]